MIFLARKTQNFMIPIYHTVLPYCSGADPEFGKKGGILLKKVEEQKKKKKVTTIIASDLLPNILYHVCYVK